LSHLHLCAEDLRFAYAEGDFRLEVGRVELAAGEAVACVGASGSGKTTLVHLLTGVLSPTAGRVVLDGKELASMSEQERRELRLEKMGMVFQHFALFPHRSVIDNVGYGLRVQKVPKAERDAAALKALSLVGLDSYAGAATSELSGGMQQRVGLARALATDPDILLMDEAFSALDPLIRRQMQDELMAIQGELHKTILFITHDLNEALRIGDRVCIMKDGAVVQIGTPEQILTEPATAYVAEFVQDVDQGRVIETREVMIDAVLVDPSSDLQSALQRLGDGSGGFVVDGNGTPTSVLTLADGLRAAALGSTELGQGLRTDFETCRPGQTLNQIYASAGRGLPLAVVDEQGRLVGMVEPRDIMEEMGRVERLIDDFEREVFL